MKRRMTVVLVLALAVVAMAAISAWATGTPAGTIIRNTATLNYKDVNGNAKQQKEAFVETTVLTKRGVDVTPDAGYTVLTEDKITEYAFTVTNTGNAPDTLALSIAGVNTDGWTYEILWDANGNGFWDEGEETDVTTTGVLAQDASYKVIVRVTAPATANYNGSDTVTLTATSSDGTTKDTGVVNITLSSANVDIAKVASTTAPVPLVNFTYTITVTNSDLDTQAYDVVMTDVLDADLAYVSSVASLGSAVESAGTLTWTIGTLPADTTATLTITVYVKEETPQGSPITNTASLAYEDWNGNRYTDTASSEPGTTQEKADVNITTAYVSPTYVNPGDFIVVPFTITNTGNGTDSYDLTDSDSGTLALNYTFYKDADGDGVLVAGDDFLDADGDGLLSQGDTILMSPITNTGDLAMDEEMTFVAIASVPTTALYTDTSVVTVTATSTSDTGVSKSFIATSEVMAPVLTLSKGVDLTSAKPGDTLTYTLTIENTGDGVAYEAVLYDAIPLYTTYVAGSITVDGVVQTDADDLSDKAKFDGTGVTVRFDTINPGATIVVKFKVTIN